MLEADEVIPVAQILGSSELLPFILDLVQLLEIHRVRVRNKWPGSLERSQSFWRSLSGLGRWFSAKEIQCLRNTIPVAELGRERYDAATLSEYMFDRFEYCRGKWEMHDLPNDYSEWWNINYAIGVRNASTPTRKIRNAVKEESQIELN